MRSLIIGITGGSGAGKSTLARKVLEHFGADGTVIVTQDSYYKDHSHLPMSERQVGNFDEPAAVELDALARDLELLKRGQAVRKPIYEYATHSRIGSERVEPKPLIVVEGLFVLHDEGVAKLLDVAIFVDADEATRVRRRIERDTTERGFTREQVLKRLRETVLPMHEVYVEPTRGRADFVIDGTRELDAQLPPVWSRIEYLRSRDVKSSDFGRN